MDINPKGTPRTVRFSENLEANHNDVENNSVSENPFRVPQLPVHGLKKKKQQKSPLKNANNGGTQMQISPGTSATDRKQAAMLEKLEKRRNQNRSKWEKQKQEQSAPVLDLGETERSFLDQSFIPPPRPSFSNMSMIQPTDTFIEAKVVQKSGGLACSTPRRPQKSKEEQEKIVPHVATPRPNTSHQVLFENQPIYESHEDIAERQFKAICEWCNALLNTCNHFDDGIADLGKTKEDATKKLQELLSKKGKEAVKTDQPKFSYKEFLRKQEFDVMRKKALQVYNTDEMPQKIVNMVQMGVITIRDGSNVYSDLILKTTLLRVFLSFNPVWLHLGLETVFATTINIPDGSSFLSVMTRFINTYVFSDPEIMKLKKYAIGTVKRLPTPEGRTALHRHFLTKSCQFFYCVEKCKMNGVIPSDPRLFVRKGQFKSLADVFSEISREVLSATGTPLAKAFTKLGFVPQYKQDYFDDLEYKINSIADLNDGVNLGKLVEVACNLGRRAVMSKLRNPGGDRLRKIGNVSVVLDIANKAGVDVGQIRPEAIVAGNMEAILEVMWKIIGVFVLSSNDKAQQLRKETKRRSLLNNSGQEFHEGEQETAKTFEHFIMDICQSLGISYGITISCFEDLKDGILLSIIWRDYNKKAADIHFYEGKDLFRKVVNAAVSELDIPSGLHFSLPLFVHQFLSRVFEISRLNEAATRIQKAYRSHRFFKALWAYLKSEEYLNMKKNRHVESHEDEIIVVDNCKAQPEAENIQLVSYDESNPSNKSTLSFNNQTYAVNHDSTLTSDSQQDDVENNTASTYLETTLQSTQFDDQTYAINPDGVSQENTQDTQETDGYREENTTTSEHGDISPVSVCLEEPTGMDASQASVDDIQQEMTESEGVQNATASTYLEMSTQSTLLERTGAATPSSAQMEIPAEPQDTTTSTIDRSAASTLPDNRTYVVTSAPEETAEYPETSIFKTDEERRQNFLNIVRQCEEESATIIQKHWRGYLARKQYNRMRSEVVPNITNIQKLARGALARNKLRDYLDKSKREKVVVKLQSHIRQFLARRKYSKLIEEKEDEERKIVLVQSCIRRFLARNTYRKLLEKKISFEKLVVNLQSHVRSYLAKKKLQQLRKQAFERKVTIVQAAVRRHLAAKHVRQLKVAKVMAEMDEIYRNRAVPKEELENIEKADTSVPNFEAEAAMEEEATLDYITKMNAARTIQRFFRNFVNFKRFLAKAEELAREKEYERNVVIIQSAVRRFLAMRELQRLKESVKQLEFEALHVEQAGNQKAEEQKIIRVQSLVRGFLARRKINRVVQENIVKLEETLHETSIISPLKTPTYVDRIRPRLVEMTPSTPELLRTLRRLRKEIIQIKSHNAACEQKITNLKLIADMAKDAPIAQIEELEREPSPEEKREPSLEEPSPEEQEAAAITIQKFWRGHRTRTHHKDHIVKRRSAMQIYREDIEKIDASFDAKSSAYKRLEECTEMLFHTSMYKQKVAAVTIERIIKLSSHLCNYFVLNCDGLSALLDRMEQGDRSPGETEIIGYLSQALEHIISMARSRPAIQKKVMKYPQDILKILFHKLNAFHNNVKIVKASISGIVGLKKIDESVSFEKAKYYISQADRRYTRLSHDHPLYQALDELKKWYK